MSIGVGKYLGKPCGVDLGQTQGGNEYIAIGFDIPGHGMETWNGYLSEKTVARTIGVLRMLGWKGSDLAAITVADLPGWAQLDVREDKDREGNINMGDDGKPRTRIAWVNSPSGMTGAPLGAESRKALSLRLRKVIADAPLCTPTLEPPKASAPAPRAAELNDDFDPDRF